jgi:phosphoglycerate-specific signal transduction histidine kinase
MVGKATDMCDPKNKVSPDFKGLGHSKIGYFKEVRAKIRELETLNIQLAHRHNRLDGIFNSMSDGVTILDSSLNIVYANRVQKEMFPEISSAVMSCHQIFYQRDRRCPDCPALRTLETGAMLQGEHMHTKGHLVGRYFEWSTTPITDAFGKVDEIILIMRDVSERKDYEFRLMQTDRMASVGFLATSLAHEINNPLTSITGFSEGLLKRLRTKGLFQDEKVLAAFKDYLEIINSEAYRCKDIIQNLRDFSSIASDESEPIRIDQIIADTVALIRQHAKDHSIKIMFENRLAAGFNNIIGKSGQLKHLFLNLFKLLFNALRAGGALKVVARNDGEKIDILLSDPGGTLSKDFEGCMTCQTQRGPAFNGQERIDLSICCNIINQHRGELKPLVANDGSRMVVLRFPAVLT